MILLNEDERYVLKHYLIFQCLFIILALLINSIGAFFHFLLDHEIPIIEAWLNSSSWIILSLSKFISFLLMYFWFKIKLYEFPVFSYKRFLKRLVFDRRGFVAALFIVLSFYFIRDLSLIDRNFQYYSFIFQSYFCSIFFLFIDLYYLSLLNDLFIKSRKRNFSLLIILSSILTLAFRIVIPDYHGLIPEFFCFVFVLFILSDIKFEKLGNSLVFLFLSVGPLFSLGGFDPIWGSEYSVFEVSYKSNYFLTALAWIILIIYYLLVNNLGIFFRKFQKL